VGREGGAYANRLGGVDGLVRFTSADSVEFQWTVSQTNYPEAVAAGNARPAGAFGGQGASVGYEHGTRQWYWEAQTSFASPGFRADAGFVPQVETRTYNAFVERTFLGDAGRWFNELTTGAGCDRVTDWNHDRASWGCDATFGYNGPLQSTFNYNLAFNREYFQGPTYTNTRHIIRASIRPSGLFSLNMNVTPGGAIDFVNAREAEQLNLNVGGTFDLFGRLNGTLSFTSQSLDVAGGRLFTARLTQSRLIYHLNVHTFVRAILQYTNISRNTALYLEPTSARTRRLFTQFLFSYKLNPHTVALVGYSDNADIARTPDLTRANRTFFTKLGYAWVP
jgi:hypothetical protein